MHVVLIKRIKLILRFELNDFDRDKIAKFKFIWIYDETQITHDQPLEYITTT